MLFSEFPENFKPNFEQLEIRTFSFDETAGQVVGPTVNEWHQDGGKIRVFMAIHGPGPEILLEAPSSFITGQSYTVTPSSAKIYRVKQGQVLIFSGHDLEAKRGIPAVWHRTPPLGIDDARKRFVITMDYK